MAKVAVLGYGTVGSGVFETLNTNAQSIDQRSGEEVRIKYVLDLRDFPGDPVQEFIVHDYNVILEDEEVSVVVEVMGGIEPAFTFAKQAMAKGKSVVTSNKELVAKHGAELLQAAKDANVNFMFEASVGGGIPIIRPLNQSLTAEDIYEISGILNGTTNYILTKMKNDGMSFSEALKLAQDKGYAEKVPDADVLGYDACRKIAILSSLALGKQVDFEEIQTEGITEITFADMEYAEELGGCIKLIAESKMNKDSFVSRVMPVIISNKNPLSTVDGVFNAILVKGNIIGDVMFYGKGAGKLPTASAVVADVIDCVKHRGTNIMHFWTMEKAHPLDSGEAESRYLIRFKETNFTEQLTDVKNSFGDCEIVKLEQKQDEFAILTGMIKGKDLKQQAAQFNGDVLNIVRVEF